MPDDGVHIQPQAEQPQPVVPARPQASAQNSQSVDVIIQQPANGLPPTSTAPSVDPAPELPVESTPVTTEAPKKLPKQKHSSDKPVGIIITAVIICLLLISGVIYLQVSKGNKTTGTPQTINRVNQAQAAAINTQDGIDATITNAESLATQAAEQPTDMSDQALGL